MVAVSHFPAGWSRSYFAPLWGFVAGAALQLQQQVLWSASLYVIVLCIGVGAGWWVWRIQLFKHTTPVAGWWLCTALLALVLGFACTGLRAAVYAATALDAKLEGQDIQVVGVVADMPQPFPGGVRFRFNVESARLHGQLTVLPELMDVGWYGGVVGQDGQGFALNYQPPDIQAGQRWRMTVRLKAPHGSMNPHGFDYELWMWEQGVQALGTVRAGAQQDAAQLMGQTARYPVAWLRQWVRDRIVHKVPDAQQAGLIAALVVGDQSAIAKPDWDIFRATGVAHLVSISGLHVTMFAWLALRCVGWWWRRSPWRCLKYPAPQAALLGGVLLACMYAVFAGWGVPAQRTCIMLATLAVLRIAGVRWPWPQVWMLAGAVVVALDPWALLQAGFWLSFVAVGILFASDSGRVAGSANGMRQRVWQMLREQWVITLALAPLTLLLFGQVSLVGLLANAMAIPWVTLVITPLAMLGVLLPGLWTMAAAAVALLMALLQNLAQWPLAVLTLPMPPLWAGVVALLGGVVMVAPLPMRVRVLGVPLMLVVLLWQSPAPQGKHFELLAPDIGQGNAVLVRTRNHALLYDAGPRIGQDHDAGARVLMPLLNAMGITLDRLLISHGDADHIGGAVAVLQTQKRADVMSSIPLNHDLSAIRPLQRCEAGQRWNWDGVDFEILHPSTADYASPMTTNAMSCVLRISNGAYTALLAGDIGQAQELKLVQQNAPLRADVLLVPHHGSKTSSSPEFLRAVAPTWALVQSGYRNRYGHPAEPVMRRYQEAGIKVLNSPQCGAMHWKTMNAELLECERTRKLHYWSHLAPN